MFSALTRKELYVRKSFAPCVSSAGKTNRVREGNEVEPKDRKCCEWDEQHGLIQPTARGAGHMPWTGG